MDSKLLESSPVPQSSRSGVRAMNYVMACLCPVSVAQRKMQQQQDMDFFDLWGPQQQSDWGYYNLQLQQPQSYQEKLPVQDPLLLSEKHNVLGQQLLSFPQEQDVDSQKNGEDSRSQIECKSTPQMELSVLPEPIAIDGQQVAREQPRSPNQQFWGEGYELFDGLPLPCDNSVQAMMQQQQQDMDLLDLFGGLPESAWVSYNPQLQQPQSYQEKLPVQDPILMSPTEQRYETFDDLAEILTEVLGIEF
ncbi:Hypothetical predicted protein [Marmota monax]|uniref:Uncharacterized protein n=1 Tax=Marmota monax TaxID=9995 RepID=A0A5E4BXR8_MARMO|nr:hypothetical protein GHT09_007802 [Marmota monax]VTJ74046.1 Hypothetical predicted protein [Marmota monax]